MTTPQLPTYPAYLVRQTSDGLRVLRLVLAALVTAGWLSDLLEVPEIPTATPGLSITASWWGLAGLATLVWLIAGPQPRLATKWAWFWLMSATPLTVAFLLLEPVPVWQTEPAQARPSRLTGGWAFLLSILIGLTLSGLESAIVAALHEGPFAWGLPGLFGTG